MVAFAALRFVIVVALSIEALVIEDAQGFGLFSKSDRYGMLTKTPESFKSKRRQDTEFASDMATFIRASAIDKPGVYSQALILLDSMKSAPSCNRVATSVLLDSCQSVDGSTTSAESSLEDLRSIYAAKLAMCEIVSAGSVVPSACKPVQAVNADPKRRAQNAEAKGKSRPRGANPLEPRHLSQCLQSLESRPQWWTSYSNNRQNAMVMCQAVRADIEKDDLIHLHESMAQTNSEVHSALSKALQEVSEILSQQSAFATAVQKFQEQLLRDLEGSHGEINSYFAKVMKSIEEVTGSIVSRLSTTIKSVETEVAELNENLLQSNTEAIVLQKNVERVFQEAVEGSLKLAASQTRQWEQSQDLAMRLQSSLGTMRDTEIQELLGAFGGIQGQLQTSNELVSMMYRRQTELDQRLINLDKSFVGLENRTEALNAAQNKQAESQARLYDQLQTEMYVVRGLLADVTSSATSLQAALDDTSSKVANLAISGAFTNTVLRWGWLTLLLFILYLLRPQYIGFATAALGSFLLWSASGIPSPFDFLSNDIVFIHYASGLQVSLSSVLKITCLVALPALVIIMYFLSARFRKFSKQVFGAAPIPALRIFRPASKHPTFHI